MHISCIDTFDHVDAIGQLGIVLSGLAVLRSLLRTLLTRIVRDEGEVDRIDEFATSARD